VLISAIGFFMAVAGVVLIAWANQPRSVGVFTTACLVFTIVLGVFILGTGRRDEQLMYAHR
jgi:hypothetical protein